MDDIYTQRNWTSQSACGRDAWMLLYFRMIIVLRSCGAKQTGRRMVLRSNICNIIRRENKNGMALLERG